jgi:transcriptional regulator with XRE-family HTH domain
MHGDIEYALRINLRDKEYAEGYAESFLNSYIATQIKVIREQRGMTQAELGSQIGTTQAGVSRYEDVNYSSWSLRTLMKLARAFDVRLRVSFEPYGTLPDEVIRFDRARLQVVEREKDSGLFTATEKSEENFGPVTDIGAFKALAGSGQARDGGGAIWKS